MNPHLLAGSRILMAGSEAYAIWISGTDLAGETLSVGQNLIAAASNALEGQMLSRSDRLRVRNALRIGRSAVQAANELTSAAGFADHYGRRGQQSGIHIIQAVLANDAQAAMAAVQATHSFAKRVRRAISKGRRALSAARDARAAARHAHWANRHLLD